jgi:hypothetical protein
MIFRGGRGMGESVNGAETAVNSGRDPNGI